MMQSVSLSSQFTYVLEPRGCKHLATLNVKKGRVTIIGACTRDESIACCSINVSILKIAYHEGRRMYCSVSIMHVAD
jgi:hypothetical protein